MKFSKYRDAWQLHLSPSGRFAVWAEPIWMRNRKGEASLGIHIRNSGMSVYFGKHLWVMRWGKI